MQNIANPAADDQTIVGSLMSAQLLGIDRFAFLRLVKRGDITPMQKMPGKRGALLFRLSDIEALRKTKVAAGVIPS